MRVSFRAIQCWIGKKAVAKADANAFSINAFVTDILFVDSVKEILGTGKLRLIELSGVFWRCLTGGVFEDVKDFSLDWCLSDCDKVFGLTGTGLFARTIVFWRLGGIFEDFPVVFSLFRFFPDWDDVFELPVTTILERTFVIEVEWV